MAAVTDLEAGLQAMLNLKPPGVSGSRITSLTTLCVSNVQSESVLIQKLYTHFKKTPGTHKLGVLYVVDSVTRKWLEKAKAQGQPVNTSAQDGTFAAGVNRVTELMPVLMNDITQSIPEDQKDKLRKLIDIWEKGQTFPPSLLQSFREKLTTSAFKDAQSTTPPGSPPSNAVAARHQVHAVPIASIAPPVAAPPSDGSAILAALANMARQSSNSSAAPSISVPAPAVHNIPASAPPHVAAVPLPQHHQQPMYPPAPNAPAGPFPNAQGYGQNNQNVRPQQYPPAPAAPVPAGSVDSNTQQQILLIKALADQGVPFDKIPAIIQSISNGAVPPPVPGAPIPTAKTYPPAPQPWQSAAGGPRGEHGHGDYGAPDRNGRRSRSRSPDRGYGGRGRDEGRGTPPQERGGKRDNDYRQRSPPGRRGHSPSSEFPPIERWIEFDSSLPPATIRVLSRTLFVGGVTCSESELRDIFGRFGIVQTCIVNKDKRHAFVKMLTRRDSESAKVGMENARDINVPLRTRWGVGFGPRDCSDYATGVSVIPINKLTEADRKWMLTALYGGTGGRPIEAGMCVEEPDIEIGAGVSSKAMSRRMQTDKGGSQGPKSTRSREDEWRGNHDNEGGRRRGGRSSGGGNSQGRGGKQDGPAFPFGIGTLPNGMPSFPPGFSFPDPEASN